MVIILEIVDINHKVLRFPLIVFVLNLMQGHIVLALHIAIRCIDVISVVVLMQLYIVHKQKLVWFCKL